MSGAYLDNKDSTALLHLRSDGTIDCEFYIQRGREKRGECLHDENLSKAQRAASERLPSIGGAKATMFMSGCGLGAAMFWATTLV